MKLSDRLRAQTAGSSPANDFNTAPGVDRLPADAVGELKARAHEALFARLGVRLFDSTLTQEQLHSYVASEIGDLMSTTRRPHCRLSNASASSRTSSTTWSGSVPSTASSPTPR